MVDFTSTVSLEQSAWNVVTRAAAYSHATMKPSGHWLCELRSTVSFTAQYIVLRTILPNNPLSQEEKSKMRLWIESHQNRNGCWGLLPKELGEEHLSTTAEAYLALKLLGVRGNKQHMQAARQYIVDSGGLSKVGLTTQILLALLGLIPWSELPQVPPELMLFPTVGPFFDIFSLAYWARTAAIPIFILRHHEPVYHGAVPSDFLDELWVGAQFPHMTYTPSLKELWHKGELTRFAGSLADKALKLLEPGLRRLPTRSLALARCVRFILDRVDDGGYGAFWASNFGAVLALTAEGLPLNHPVVNHLLKKIDIYLWEDDQGLRMQVTHGPVWDTGLMALGLLEAGLQTKAMDLTIRWLKDRQILDVSGDCHIQNPRLARGGWCYQDCVSSSTICSLLLSYCALCPSQSW
ncbi:terpenoid cyclases/protein prenyltransferase alpha-alpha toroid [Phaeosphaeria sp. MPI-PUGE-AT-0046c]|nr:terpenoid cyclases/protein prenyltransferase alpha-alpha toroid [Phaeosphaeria sp. MPI-PUGE-AT-0046c]